MHSLTDFLLLPEITLPMVLLSHILNQSERLSEFSEMLVQGLTSLYTRIVLGKRSWVLVAQAPKNEGR